MNKTQSQAIHRSDPPMDLDIFQGPGGSYGIPGGIFSPCCGSPVYINQDTTPYYICKKCDKKYVYDELVSAEEYKNMNRVKMINKMLT
jgi:hypothetical protein